MLYFGSIVFISFALLIDFCRPVFLAYPVARASITGLPLIDNATQKLFHENGFHGELVRQAGRHERQCGVVLLDYEKYTEGKWFESILQPYEEILRDAAESPQAKVFSLLKKQAVREHKEEMRTLFAEYKNSTQLHYDETDVPQSGANAGTIRKDMHHEMISMLRTHAEQEQQKRRIWNNVLATRTELHDMEELVETELSLSRYGLLFSQIRTQLFLAVESVLTELFSSGQPISHSEYSVLSAIAELMGEKRFKASALKKRYIAAGQTLKATVLSMNDRVMEVEICYPNTKEEDMGYLMKVVALGEFSDDGTEYARHELGKHYILPSSMLITNLSLLEKVEDVERDCIRMASVLLCKTKAQTSTCALDRRQRNGCAVDRHDSTDPEFALVESLIRSTVVATHLKKIYRYDGKEDKMKIIHIEQPVVVVEIPQGMTLYVGEKIAESRVMTDSTAELNITLPVESNPFGRRVKLNVGGTVFETSLSTLTSVSDSMFCALLADRWKAQEELFIDRDPTHFAKVLNYLRNSESFLPPRDDDSREDLQREAEFYNLPGLANICAIHPGDKVQWRPQANTTYCFRRIYLGSELTCITCGSFVTNPYIFVPDGIKKESFCLVRPGEKAINWYPVSPLWASFLGTVVTVDGTCCRVKWTTDTERVPKFEAHIPKFNLRLANTR